MDLHSYFADPDRAVFLDAGPVLDPADFLMQIRFWIQLFFMAYSNPALKTL